MIGLPPFAEASQLNPIYELVVISATFFKSVGGFGVVKIMAPLPTSDSKELPTILIATTLA
jgi:hypothetical protein